MSSYIPTAALSDQSGFKGKREETRKTSQEQGWHFFVIGQVIGVVGSLYLLNHCCSRCLIRQGHS